MRKPRVIVACAQPASGRHLVRKARTACHPERTLPESDFRTAQSAVAELVFRMAAMGQRRLRRAAGLGPLQPLKRSFAALVIEVRNGPQARTRSPIRTLRPLGRYQARRRGRLCGLGGLIEPFDFQAKDRLHQRVSMIVSHPNSHLAQLRPRDYVFSKIGQT